MPISTQGVLKFEKGHIKLDVVFYDNGYNYNRTLGVYQNYYDLLKQLKSLYNIDTVNVQYYIWKLEYNGILRGKYYGKNMTEVEEKLRSEIKSSDIIFTFIKCTHLPEDINRHIYKFISV